MLFYLNKLHSLGSQFLGLSLLQLSNNFRRLREKYDADAVNNRFGPHLLKSVIVVGFDGFHEFSKCPFILTVTRTNVNAAPTCSVFALFTCKNNFLYTF
uniref:Uncharacterized protein n=1 Tax=Oryzias latipes TaxID=8090 RepID=A0A3B3I4N8_ORYLA